MKKKNARDRAEEGLSRSRSKKDEQITREDPGVEKNWEEKKKKKGRHRSAFTGQSIRLGQAVRRQVPFSPSGLGQCPVQVSSGRDLEI